MGTEHFLLFFFNYFSVLTSSNNYILINMTLKFLITHIFLILLLSLSNLFSILNTASLFFFSLQFKKCKILYLYVFILQFIYEHSNRIQWCVFGSGLAGRQCSCSHLSSVQYSLIVDRQQDQFIIKCLFESLKWKKL